MITWRPWNPVAIKNVDPKAESAIQNGASIYSNNWNKVNTIPKEIVNIKDIFAFSKFLLIISWWDQVILTPEDRSRIVFKSGILIGLKGMIDFGGHICPSSIVGEILLWKNAQKNETKNNTSEAINNTIPVFKPFITIEEWFPCLEASRWISRHQAKAMEIIIKSEIDIGFIVTLFISTKPESTRAKAPLEASNGQGLMSTRWKGLNFFINFYFTSVV